MGVSALGFWSVSAWTRTDCEQEGEAVNAVTGRWRMLVGLGLSGPLTTAHFWVAIFLSAATTLQW